MFAPMARGRTLQITPAGVAGSILAIAVVLICIRLGFWQLDRLEQRRDLNAALESRMTEPPLALDRVPRDTAGLTWRRVEASGTWDHARSVVLAGRSQHGVPGVHLVTPLLVGDGGALLVIRGWLPSPDAATVDLAPYDSAGPITVRGIISPLGGSGEPAAPDTVAFRSRWYGPDLRRLPGQYPYAVAPLLVRSQSTPAGGYPAPLPALELDEGPHLGYAFQWFSFAAIALIGWLVLVARRGAGTRPPPPTGGSTLHTPEVR